MSIAIYLTFANKIRRKDFRFDRRLNTASLFIKILPSRTINTVDDKIIAVVIIMCIQR